MDKLELRAIALGAIAFTVLTGVAFALVSTASGSFMFWLLYAAPVASGAVTGYLAQHREFVSLVILGIIDATCLGVLNFALWVAGVSVDLGGLGGSLWLAALSLLSVVPLAVVGGVIGHSVRHGFHA